MIGGIPAACAPTPDLVEAYQLVWSLFLWGYSADEIAKNPTVGLSRDEVREAVRAMKGQLSDIPYQELAEEEIRLYLARNYQTEQELIQLFIQAKNDLMLLRSGEMRHSDGSRAMPVDIKALQSLLSSIEKQGQSRASVLARLASNDSGSGSPELPDGKKAALMDSLTRRPELEDTVEAAYTEVA